MQRPITARIERGLSTEGNFRPKFKSQAGGGLYFEGLIHGGAYFRNLKGIQSQSRGGHWGVLETAKTKKKIIQNRKTVKKFGQNRKPRTKPSETDTMLTSGAYRAN